MMPQRCTLHSLRATGPTALAQSGAGMHTIMSLTAHKSVSEVEHYVRSFAPYPLTRQAQEQVAAVFSGALDLVKLGEHPLVLGHY